MVCETDADAAGEPVKEDAQGEPGPGKIAWIKRQQGTKMEHADPDYGSPGDSCTW